MDISSAKRQVKDAVEAYLRKDDAGMYAMPSVHQRPLFLLGAPGIGKTAIMEQVAQELGIGIVSYSMTHHTRQSALGLPRIERHEFDGFEYEASEYTMSEIVASLYDHMKRTGMRDGILFLDEINCVSETLYPSMLQFLQFKTFGKHRIPEGWIVVCAGNPPEYNRSVHEFDVVTLDRMRELDVEPDYPAWKKYASEKGLHPAVVTFLETKNDCFYQVRSKPGGGKAFVTARGWEDLAWIIGLHEDMGKPVDRDLMAQYIRDDEIADQFSLYYALFEKYRSDYQVDAIVAGEAGDAIKDRARAAGFDERIALIGLILDVVARQCARVLDREGVILEVRDMLRDVKAELLEAAAADVAILPRVTEREKALDRKVGSGVVSDSFIRRERLVIKLMRSFVARCAQERTEGGPEAFRTIEGEYQAEVGKIKPAAAEASAGMDHAFDFVEECFGTREMLVFMAELTTRQTTAQFIAHYGNASYYARNQELQADSSRRGLNERADLLREMDESVEHAGLRPAAPASASRRNAEQVSLGSQETGPDGRLPAPSAGILKDYYGGKQFEYGFTSVCKMLLPASLLRGKNVLDVACRRGRGVYKLSAMVGDGGGVIGIDWNASFIDEAKDGMERAWRKNNLVRNNMEFRVAYPEDLIAAGIGSSTMDAVYVNNVMTLLYSQAEAIKEFARVLKPGGLLIMETVFADRARDDEVVARARAAGNSIQAARTCEENLAWLAAAGFGEPTMEEDYEVEVQRGDTADRLVEVVDGDGEVRYWAVSMRARKESGTV